MKFQNEDLLTKKRNLFNFTKMRNIFYAIICSFLPVKIVFRFQIKLSIRKIRKIGLIKPSAKMHFARDDASHFDDYGVLSLPKNSQSYTRKIDFSLLSLNIIDHFLLLKNKAPEVQLYIKPYSKYLYIIYVYQMQLIDDKRLQPNTDHE